MKDHDAPPESVACGRCAASADSGDNFCRRCGLALTEQRLPSVANSRALPAVWRPPVPAVVVKGAAFIAAGTLAEALLRRLVRRTFGERQPAPPAKLPGNGNVASGEMNADEGETLSETLLLRHIRVRR